MSGPLLATVIGGYLGAGKTTLVNQLLRNANGQRLAVLVNEFGALPIDEDLIEAESDDLISISGGCICCSFGSDLTAALIDLAALDPRPDHVVIESSGVAMPGAIGASIGLLDQYRLAGVVVLADSETVQAQATDEYLGDTTLRQLHDAHLIIQTKTDLVSGSQAALVSDWLSDTNPAAAQVRAANGVVPNAVVLGQTGIDLTVAATAHADAAFESQVFKVDGLRNPQQLAEAIASGRFGVVRGKGFVRGEQGEPYLIQTVGARAVAEPYSGAASCDVVCIGLRGQLDIEGLTALFSEN